MSPKATFASFLEILKERVNSYGKHAPQLRSDGYDEAKLRNDYLNPIWRALGWDLENQAGLTQQLREVDIESRVDEAGKKKRADYLFRTDGLSRFICEAKKPKEELSLKFAFQAQKYAFNSRLLISTLTNFESFKVYVVGGKPRADAPWDVCKQWHYTEYVAHAQEIWDLFSREAVASNSLERFITSLPKREIAGRARQGWLIAPERVRPVDSEFLEELEGWRETLARDLVKNNPRISWTDELLNESIQRILDRILFVRICEDRDIDTGRSLELICREWQEVPINRPPLYSWLVAHFNSLDVSFNGALFKRGHESEKMKVSDSFLADLIGDLSSEDSPYLFSTWSVDILGSVYERFIGKVVRITRGGNVKVELKPEVRKAGGVYYTPDYIVDYIVEQTVGRVVADKSPKEVARLKFLDPACGSGSFLTKVFDRLCQHHLKWLLQNPRQQRADVCYRDDQNNLHLTTHTKRAIMLDTIFGVDLDYRAIEVTMLSLYLKILENETRTTLGQQRGLFPKETFLPDLSANIKCGNSLIAPDIAEHDKTLFASGSDLRLDTFDWEAEFPTAMHQGGFDVVLGNPPYGADLNEDDAEYLRATFATANKDLDTYGLFIEQAIKKCKARGLVSMIVPTGWYSGAKFPRLRRFVATETDPLVFVNLPYDIFDAWVDTTIFVVQRRKKALTWPRTESAEVTIRTFAKRHRIRKVQEFTTDLSKANFAQWFSSGGDEYLTYADDSTTELMKKLQTKGVCPLSHFADVQRGVTPFNIVASRNGVPNARAAFNGTVRRYLFDRGTRCFIQFDDTLAEPKPERYFKGPRLLLREMISRKFRLQAVKVTDDFVTNKSMQSILQLPDGPDLDYLLGCINSKLMSWYFLRKSNIAQRDDFPKIVLKETRALPIPVPNAANIKQIHVLVKVVRRMQDLCAQVGIIRGENQNTRLMRQIAATDRQIDRLVYEIYGLTSEEIALIEDSEIQVAASEE